MPKLRRRVRINAQGKELYKFINSIRNEGITCLGQYVRHEVFCGEVYRCDIEKLRENAEKYGIELKEAEYTSVMSVLSKYRKRIGVLIGIILAMFGFIWFSQSVVTIEIQGNDAVSDEVILSALEQLDIKRGKLIRDIDMHYCEHELQIRVSGISWAAIRRTGNRIVVQVTEVTEKPEMLLERIPCNVVSSKDAEITEVNVLDGMLMHKVGDYVPEGTLLINGVAEDDTGHITIHHAYGFIKGKYTETAEFKEKLRQHIYVPTGRKDKKRYLRLFSADIPLFISRNNYENADKTTTEKTLEIFGKKIPIGIVTDTLSETSLTETILTDEEAEQLIMEKIYLYEKNFLGECKILKRDIKREKTADSIIFKVEYRIEGEIGLQKEIFIK